MQIRLKDCSKIPDVIEYLINNGWHYSNENEGYISPDSSVIFITGNREDMGKIMFFKPSYDESKGLIELQEMDTKMGYIFGISCDLYKRKREKCFKNPCKDCLARWHQVMLSEKEK